MTDTRTIETRFGTLELHPTSRFGLRAVANYWPLEIIDLPGERDVLGLVFQRGGAEMRGAKLQAMDLPTDRANVVHHRNRLLIAAALAAYVERGHAGLMVPCAYYRRRSADLAETGLAFFVGPDSRSQGREAGNAGPVFDEALGAGATAMILDLIHAVDEAGDRFRIPTMDSIGLDLHPHPAIGGLALQFAVHGDRIYVAAEELDEGAPQWGMLVQQGLTSLPYAPMRATALA